MHVILKSAWDLRVILVQACPAILERTAVVDIVPQFTDIAASPGFPEVRESKRTESAGYINAAHVAELLTNYHPC
jgi:hypothetical protein